MHTVPHEHCKNLIFFLGPFFGRSWFFEQVDGLVFKKNALFIGKDATKVFPIQLSLELLKFVLVVQCFYDEAADK